MPVGSVPIEDQKRFIDWMWEQKEQVNFDATPLTYPRAVMVIAKQAEETIAMVPAHPVLMLEAMASEQSLDRRYMAMGLWRIGEQVEKAMRDTQMNDCYVLINDEGEVLAVKKRGWKEILHDPVRGVWLMRRRLEARGV
jgi:hypothetical protein